MPTQATALLGLMTETPLHAGTGQATGIIDLPIQREVPTGYPCVYGSAVKGSLRARAEAFELTGLDVVFGPDHKNASEHAGALAIGDARLLLLPVRSLTSHFKWVTCPDLLRRFQRDAARLGLALPAFQVPAVEDSHAWVPAEVPTALFLEEYRFEPQQTDLSGVIAAITRLLDRPEAEQALNEQLVIVSDDLFAHLAGNTTAVNAHVRIENDTKTVARGALWYEETLPPETLLYVALHANAGRQPSNGEAASPWTAQAVRDAVLSALFKAHPYLQLGGNETVGMGWSRVTAFTDPTDTE